MIDTNMLMVNDWICLDNDTDYLSPIQVQQIRVNEIVADFDVYECNDIHPIPLSDEIFENNNFNFEWGKHTHTWWIASEKSYISIVVEGQYNPGEVNYTIMFDEQFKVNDTIEIKYVHELQHILRIAFPEKEIIL